MPHGLALNLDHPDLGVDQFAEQSLEGGGIEVAQRGRGLGDTQTDPRAFEDKARARAFLGTETGTAGEGPGVAFDGLEQDAQRVLARQNLEHPLGRSGDTVGEQIITGELAGHHADLARLPHPDDRPQGLMECGDFPFVDHLGGWRGEIAGETCALKDVLYGARVWAGAQGLGDAQDGIGSDPGGFAGSVLRIGIYGLALINGFGINWFGARPSGGCSRRGWARAGYKGCAKNNGHVGSP